MEGASSKSAADEIRAATKWLLAAVFAVATALFALLPAVFPTDRSWSWPHMIVAIVGALAVMVTIGLTVASAARVLTARPATVKDVIDLLDDQGSRAEVRALAAGLNSNRIELASEAGGSIRRLFGMLARGDISTDDYKKHASQVLAFTDLHFSRLSFEALLRRLAILAPVATLSLVVAIASVLLAPRNEHFDWLEEPRVVDVVVPKSKVPTNCEAQRIGELVALGRDSMDAIVNFAGTAGCPAFSLTLDTLQFPLLTRPD